MSPTFSLIAYAAIEDKPADPLYVGLYLHVFKRRISCADYMMLPCVERVNGNVSFGIAAYLADKLGLGPTRWKQKPLTLDQVRDIKAKAAFKLEHAHAIQGATYYARILADDLSEPYKSF